MCKYDLGLVVGEVEARSRIILRVFTGPSTRPVEVGGLVRSQIHTLSSNSGRATNLLWKLRLTLPASPGQQWEVGVRISLCF